MKYRVDVLAYGEHRWAHNALRFDTKEEATDYARNLHSRWMGAQHMRVVLDTVPERETFVPGSEDW